MFRRVSQKTQKIMQNGLIGLIRLYQLLSSCTGYRCRFYPTCSSYAMDAITQFGLIKGLYLSGRRLFRCHPFHQGGYDPIPKKRIKRVKVKS